MLAQFITLLGIQIHRLLVNMQKSCASLTGGLGREMMYGHRHFWGNPKFNDDYERAMANDINYHLARAEPSLWGVRLQRLGRHLLQRRRSC